MIKNGIKQLLVEAKSEEELSKVFLQVMTGKINDINTLDRLLEMIVYVYDADRVQIYEVDDQSVKNGLFRQWSERENVEVMHSLKSPIVTDGKVVGYLEVDNPRTNEEKTTYLSFVSVYCYNEMIHLKKNEQIMGEYGRIVRNMSRIYNSIYYINLEDDRYKEIAALDIVKEKMPSEGVASERLRYFCENLIDPESIERMKEFTDLTTMSARLAGTYSISAEYISKVSVSGLKEWRQATFFVGNYNEKGQISHVIMTNHSIHESKVKELEAAEVLKSAYVESQELLKYTSALASDFLDVYIVDPVKEECVPFKLYGEIVKESEKYKSSCMEEVNHRIREYIYKEDEALLDQIFDFKNILEILKEKGSCEYVYRIINNKGCMVHFMAKYYLLKDTEYRILAAFQDIEHIVAREAEQNYILECALDEARIANRNIERVHEALHSASWTMQLTEDGNVTKINMRDVYQRILGYEKVDGLEDDFEHWMSCIHLEDREQVNQLIKGVIEDWENTPSTIDFEHRVKVYNNTWKWVRSCAHITRRQDGSPSSIYGIYMDIDEQKHNEVALQDALAVAEHANRAKTTFLNNMSHDIRTPMNAIIGFTSLAATHIDNKEHVLNYLSKISTSSNHLLSLINDVLDMSRIESGKVNINEKEENLSEILHSLRDIVQADIHAKQMNFYMDTVDVTDEDVWCDKLRLNQILLNIVSNALKFTLPRGIISVRVSQKAIKANGYATYEFRIKDNGIGISSEFVENIFDPFTREQAATVNGIPGTGLGMAITKNIVDMMGGTIVVYSKKNEGTEFVVNLDFKLLKEHRKIEVIRQLEGLRGLVVDDDMNACQSISDMLRTIGMRAEWCTFGKEAVVRTQEAIRIGDKFAVYVIDWLMPDMNGIETTRRIRKVVGDDVPIVILTAYDWKDIEEEALEAGVTKFVSKPLFPSDLRRVLMEACGEYVDVSIAKVCTTDFTGRRVLLAEDVEMNCELVTDILGDVGFEVESVTNGQLACETLLKKGAGYYDLVLMDIQMPVMGGYEASEKIRAFEDKRLSQIPIIAMTANAFEEDKERAMQAGMNAHIAKPIDNELLFEILERILEIEK